MCAGFLENAIVYGVISIIRDRVTTVLVIVCTSFSSGRYVLEWVVLVLVLVGILVLVLVGTVGTRTSTSNKGMYEHWYVRMKGCETKN